MSGTTVQSSELSRNSAAVFAAADAGPVTVTRRDGADLVLSLAANVDDERRALRIAADLVAASLADTGEPLGDRLRTQFPWVEFLRPGGREAFAAEIVAVTRACAAVGEFRRLLITFEAWRSTATAIASGYTPDEDLDWIDGPVVTDPRHEA